MIENGQYATLEVLRDTPPGLFLGDEDGNEVLLPNKYVPREIEIGEEIPVFVYRDFDERLVATTLNPYVNLNEFALLKCEIVDKVGAFMDMGLEKQLLVPFAEQKAPMQEGRWYIIRMMLDEKTDRLYGSNRIDRFITQIEPPYEVGEQVEILVWKLTDLGWKVIVDHMFEGLIYHNEKYGRELRVGEARTAYVKTIRPDGKMDMSLRPIGYLNTVTPDATKILEKLELEGGWLNLTDKSDPDQIRHTLQMSKKAFKRAVGALYKAQLIDLQDDGIKLTARQRT